MKRLIVARTDILMKRNRAISARNIYTQAVSVCKPMPHIATNDFGINAAPTYKYIKMHAQQRLYKATATSNHG